MLDVDSYRKAGYAAIDSICDMYSRLDDLPVQAQVQPGYLRSLIPAEAPQEGEDWTKIDDDFHKIIVPGMSQWQSGMFAAYFPGNATFEGQIADLYASAVSNPGFNWACSPASTELEIIVVDWWAKMQGLGACFQSQHTDSPGGGIIQASATEGCLTVAVAAREKIIAEYVKGRSASNGDGIKNGSCNGSTPDSLSSSLSSAAHLAWREKLTPRLVMYGTTQTHSATAKVARVLGLTFRALEVFAKDGYALRGETLKKALEDDIATGKIPFLLVLTLGTTSSGAVDDITECAEVAQAHPTLWVHVDAAYAGVALTLPELRASSHLDAINDRIDSICTNVHKWGLVQLECSPLHVRDRLAVNRAMTITPEFLRTKEGDAGTVVDLRNMQLALGRRFRSLKLWFVLRSFGVKGFQAHLRHSMACSDVFKVALERHEDLFEIVAPPRWSMVLFRLNPRGEKGPTEALDELNRHFKDKLDARSAELTLTHTVLPELGFCIRYVVGSPFLRKEHAAKAFRIVYECAMEVLREQ